MAFETIVETMMEMTLFQLFFPWLLVLAITYGVLQQYDLFGDEDSIDAIISLSVAFMTVGGAYLFIPEGMLSHVAAVMTFAVFAVLGLVIVLAVAGYDISQLSENDRSLPLILGIGIFLAGLLSVILTYFEIPDIIPEIQDTQFFYEEVILPIAILVFIIAIVAMTFMGGED